ncbi:hypothetical protein PFISCL1PPCAC_17870, partial [Pristionchus fissidentatus]
ASALHTARSMADDNDEKIIADAFSTIFEKPVKIPPDLYTKMTYDLRMSEGEAVKLNITLKHGIVLNIDDDSQLRAFLNVGDVLLTVNGKVASTPDFKLQDQFKDKRIRVIPFTYIRFRNQLPDMATLREGEQRDQFTYKMVALFGLRGLPLGIVFQGFEGRVLVAEVHPRSLGSMGVEAGDIILHVNGERMTDTSKTLDDIMAELKTKCYVKLTIERAGTDLQRALITHAIGKKKARDRPVPADCLDYVRDALIALKQTDTRSILRAPHATGTESVVAFHDRIQSESVIPSDIMEEALFKTPARVPPMPGAPPSAPSPLPSSPAPSSPVPQSSSGEQVEKPEQSLMKGAMLDPPPPAAPAPAPTPAKKNTVRSTNRKSKVTTKKSGESKSRKRLSTEGMFGRNKKKSTADTPSKQKRKAKAKTNSTTADTE